MIQVKNLSKNFKDKEVLNGISFTVKEGEIFGLLGENGAGKTTTLRILATMLKPTNGTAIMGGADIVKHASAVRRKIGILFGGETGLYDRLTARENIAYFGQLNDMPNDLLKKRIDELTETFQMQEFIDKRVAQFSKGMKQKVAIARSIVHNPDIMLFDEPTSGLDVSAARVIHNFIIECNRQYKTILFSSHSMKEVEKICDRVGVIHKGELIHQGTIEQFKVEFEMDDFEEIFVRMVGIH